MRIHNVGRYASPIVRCSSHFYSLDNLLFVPGFGRPPMLYTLSTDEEGQGLTEYAVILVLVAVVVVAILVLLGPQVANLYSRVTNGIAGH